VCGASINPDEGELAGASTVAQSTLANVGHLEGIFDKGRFRARVEELAGRETLPREEATTIKEFLDAWRRHDLTPHE
jgi:hypothetical protein